MKHGRLCELVTLSAVLLYTNSKSAVWLCTIGIKHMLAIKQVQQSGETHFS